MRGNSLPVCMLTLSLSIQLVAADSPAKTAVGNGFAVTGGGSGGQVVRVTNLEPSGPGSLRAVLEIKGPRIVVFEVGGVIDLAKKSLKIPEPFVTVAGQTAPSPGITLIKGTISVGTHDVIIQHIRVRPGDAGAEKKSGWEPDGLCAAGSNAYNVVVDHCSFSWAVDENLSASGPRLEGPQATAHRVTFSNCIIAEGLSNATHTKGEHSKGSLIHDCCQDVAIIGNLYAHNMQRNPYFKAHCTGVIVNNVIYDPGSTAIQMNFSDKEWEGAKFAPTNCRVSVVGNVMIYGASTRKDLALVSRKGDAYMEDNLAFRVDGSPAPLISGEINQLDVKPVWPEGLHALPSGEVVDFVVQQAGARPNDRDEVDRRIISNLVERKGKIIDSQNDVGGYPRVEMRTRKLEIPSERLDEWLAGMAADLMPDTPARKVSSDHSLSSCIDKAWEVSWKRFYLPRTKLFYDYLTSYEPGRELAHLPSVDEIQRQYPNVFGYGTGMEDCMISAGVILALIVDQYAVTKNEELRERARLVFEGIQLCATAHGAPGFLARGVCADDLKSIYINSSRDQYTHAVHGLWHYFHSPLCSPDTKKAIGEVVAAIADRMTRNVTPENDYDSLRADGKRDERGISRMWNVDGHEAARLPMIYAAAWDMTGKQEYYELYRKYIKPAVEQSFTAKEKTTTYAFLQMQCSLDLLESLEKDPELKKQMREIMAIVAKRCAARAVNADKNARNLDMTMLCSDWRTGEGLSMKGQYRKVWYCIRESGEAAVAQMMARDGSYSDEQKDLLKAMITRIDYDRVSTCGIFYLQEAYWKARKDGFIEK